MGIITGNVCVFTIAYILLSFQVLAGYQTRKSFKCLAVQLTICLLSRIINSRFNTLLSQSLTESLLKLNISAEDSTLLFQALRMRNTDLVVTVASTLWVLRDIRALGRSPGLPKRTPTTGVANRRKLICQGSVGRLQYVSRVFPRYYITD